MQELQDFKLTDLIKIRKYFDDRSNELMTEVGVPSDEKQKFDILRENVQFIDKYIALDFQTIKFDTELPKFHTRESYKKANKDINDYNSQVM